MMLQYRHTLLTVGILGFFSLQLLFAAIAATAGGGGGGGDGPQTGLGNAILNLLLGVNALSNFLPSWDRLEAVSNRMGNAVTFGIDCAVPVFTDITEVGSDLCSSAADTASMAYRNLPDRASLMRPITAGSDVISDIKKVPDAVCQSISSTSQRSIEDLQEGAHTLVANATNLKQALTQYLPTTKQIEQTFRTRRNSIIAGIVFVIITGYLILINSPSKITLNPAFAGSLADVTISHVPLPSFKKLAFKYGPSVISMALTGASSYYIFTKYSMVPIAQTITNIFTDPNLLRKSVPFHRYLSRLKFWRKYK